MADGPCESRQTNEALMNAFSKSIRLLLSGFPIAGLTLAIVPIGWAAPEIPSAAWSRPLGQPLAGHGRAIQPDQIDDGIWQGAPVGGFGAGTFLRSFRGDFVRWHIEPGVDKYATVDADQFAMFQQS